MDFLKEEFGLSYMLAKLLFDHGTNWYGDTDGDFATDGEGIISFLALERGIFPALEEMREVIKTQQNRLSTFASALFKKSENL